MYEYKANLVRVVDGDTLRLVVDVGFNMTFTANFRLHDIDTPELGTEEGQRAKEAVQSMLADEFNFNITTYKPDKYGRWLVEVYPKKFGGQSLNTILVREGLATYW